MSDSELKIRASKYEKQNSIEIDFDNPLGHGTDGSVWRTNRPSAIKSFEHRSNYQCELKCYRRLEEHNLIVIDGFTIPKLVGSDDNLMIVEMSIVSPPFLLDFGKAYLDSKPEHTSEVMEDWEAQQNFLWGERNSQVKVLLWQLEKVGIYYQDPKPGNIMFEEF